MTDQELIRAVRFCYKGMYSCDNCPNKSDENACRMVDALELADRLEALLAENERLKAQVSKWQPASDPPKATGEYLVDMTAYLGGAKRHQEVLHFTTARESFIPAGSWYKICDYGFPEIVSAKEIISWMPLPSTEEVSHEDP